MRLVRSLVALAVCVSGLVAASAGPAAAQFTIGGDPRVNPNDFRITTFASGLNFPTGMVRLSDGSILIATSNPTGSYFNSSGTLLRFVDANGDGVADGPGQVMYTDSVGVWTDLRVAGNLVFITSAMQNAGRITILRMNSGPASAYTAVGRLDFTFLANWEHQSYALETRPAPGGPANTFELYFNVGSDANFGQSSATASVGGLITGTQQGGSIYRVLVTDTGTGVSVSNLVQIASGLRNAAGLAFHPTTGDLYFEDNGIDGLTNATVEDAFSADEINRIAAADLGVIVPDFGFPNDYIEYRTGRRVGSGGVQPLVAFQPIPMPNGSESEGPSRIAFAPAGFPSYLSNGIVVGFHGQFGKPPDQNEENPVVFWDLGTGQYFHFIENFQLGHPDFFLATTDSLFVGDMAGTGDMNTAGTGAIYQIKRVTPSSQLSAWFTNPMPGTPLSGTVTVGMAESNATGSITWTLTVDGTNVFTTTGTGTTASFDWNANSVSFGAHTLGLTIQDGGGRTASATRTVKVVAPLTASFTSPASGAAVSGTVTVVMVETGDYNSPITFNLTVDGAQVFTTTGTPNSASFDWNTAGYSAGSHTLGLLVRDGVGRTATATRTVSIVGNGQLTASIDSPAEGATVSGTVPVAMSETNGTGTISWTLRLDGGTPIFSGSGPAPTASFSWDTAGVTPGAHHLDLTVQDGGGRMATATRNVVVGGGAVAVAITQPNADSIAAP